MTTLAALALWLAAVAGLCVLFVVPAIIAFRREHPNRWPILVVNVCLGGTGLGWAAALIWALHAVHRPNGMGSPSGGESGLNLFANDVHPVRLVSSGGPPAVARADHLTTAAAAAEIERLDRLRGTGALSDSEFEALKAGTLARLTHEG